MKQSLYSVDFGAYMIKRAGGLSPSIARITDRSGMARLVHISDECLKERVSYPDPSNKLDVSSVSGSSNFEPVICPAHAKQSLPAALHAFRTAACVFTAN